MPVPSKSSPITAVAIILSLALGLGVAFFLYKPDPKKPAPAATTSPAGSVAKPDKPPAAAATVAAADEATSPTLAPAAKRLPITGLLIDSEDNPVANGMAYAVEYAPGGVEAVVRQAFAKENGYTLFTAGKDGAFSGQLDAGKAYFVGAMLSDEPQPFAQLINERGDEASAEVKLSLPKPYELRGAVLDNTGVNVPGIPMVINWRVATLRDRKAPPQTLRAMTNAEGRFSLQIQEPASVSVSVDAEQLPAPYLSLGEPIDVTRTELAGTQVYRVDLELIRGVDIEGRVLQGESEGAATRGVPACTVALEPIPAPGARMPLSRAASIQTDDEGHFRFTRLFPGRYRVTAGHAEYNKPKPVEATAGDASAVEIVLHPFSRLDGVVVAGQGAVPGTKVVISLLDRYDGKRIEKVPGDDNRAAFAFDGVKPGVYLLAAESVREGSAWYSEQSVEVSPGGGGGLGEITLQPLGEARGQLVGDSADAFKALAVSAQPVDNSGDPFPDGSAKNGWRRLPVTSVSESGLVTVENLRSGVDYLLLVTKRDKGTVVGSAVSSSAATRPVKIALGGTGDVTGRVRNSRDEACVGVELELKTGLSTLEGAGGDIQVRVARTDYQGEYHFPHVPAGQSSLSLRGDPGSDRLVGVTAGGSFAYDFKCRSFVAVSIELVGTPEKPYAAKEQFYVIPQPGTKTAYPIKELQFGSMKAELEPGAYTITRVSTLESRTFEVTPRMDGSVPVDFSPVAKP